MTSSAKIRFSLFGLGFGLACVTVLFGVRVKYSPVLFAFIAGTQFIVLSIAAWHLGGWAIKSAEHLPKSLAAAGLCLVAPWFLFSFLAGIGPPGDQLATENQWRYLILLINAMWVAGGLILLKGVLAEAGERFYSKLGFIAITLATPFYLIWATIMLGSYRALELAGTGDIPPWIKWINDPSDILLFFGGALTYLSTFAFSISLRRCQWLAGKTARLLMLLPLIALGFLIARGLQFTNPARMVWYQIPGFVVGIPAIPWIIPCIFGAVLLRRAGKQAA